VLPILASLQLCEGTGACANLIEAFGPEIVSATERVLTGLRSCKQEEKTDKKRIRKGKEANQSSNGTKEAQKPKEKIKEHVVCV
jgi:hypothetical protein